MSGLFGDGFKQKHKVTEFADFLIHPMFIHLLSFLGFEKHNAARVVFLRLLVFDKFEYLLDLSIKQVTKNYAQ